MSDNAFTAPIGKPAMGVGAMVAGCDYFTGYPITPQTELLEYISQALPKHGGTFQQMGDEISSIMALFGASAAGKRVMTASVGPGITLMIDGRTNAAGAETPMVLGVITRAHVEVSAALLPAQSDIRMLKGLGNGDYHLPIPVPDSVTETAQLTAEAFDISDQYTTPVIVSIDGTLSNMIETLQPFEVPERDLPKKDWTLDNAHEERRRLVGAFRQIELDTPICYNLQHKYEVMREKEVRYEAFQCDDVEFIVVAFGIMARIVREAVTQARARGIKVGLFRPITIFPFPETQLHDLAGNAKEVLVTEMNLGQVLVDVRLAVNGQCPIQFLGQPANPIPASAVLEAIEEMSRGEQVRARTFLDVHPNPLFDADSLSPEHLEEFERLAARAGAGDVQGRLDDLMGIRRSEPGIKGVGA